MHLTPCFFVRESDRSYSLRLEFERKNNKLWWVNAENVLWYQTMTSLISLRRMSMRPTSVRTSTPSTVLVKKLSPPLRKAARVLGLASTSSVSANRMAGGIRLCNSFVSVVDMIWDQVGR